MTDGARLPFWLALALSLMLHLTVLTAPGWGLQLLAEEPLAEPLTATLVMAVSPRPQPAAPAATLPPQPVVPLATPAVPLPVSVAAAPEAEPAPVPAQPPPEAESEPASAQPLPAVEPAAPSVDPAPAPLAVPAAPTFAAIWPKHGRIVYQVTRGESGLLIGQAEHRWQHDGVHYQIHAVIETVGLAALFKPVKVVQESHGMFVAAGLQPLEFKHERDGQLTYGLRLDPAQRQIIFSNGDQHDSAEGEVTQDLLSLFYQLGAMSVDRQTGPVTVATARKVERYPLFAGPMSTFNVPFAHFGARRVQHFKLPGSTGADSTEVWLDTLTHLPLKIRHRDRKGEVFDQTATAVELDLDPIE